VDKLKGLCFVSRFCFRYLNSIVNRVRVLSDRVSAASQQQMLCVQETLIQTLQSLIASSHPLDSGLFPRLLMMMSSLRELSLEYRRMFMAMRDRPDAKVDSLHSEVLEILGLM